MNNYFSALQQQFPTLTFTQETPLAPFTAIKIGGPAEVLVTVTTSDDLAHLIQFCVTQSIPYTLLGWGANTLIADRGIRGLVIRNTAKELNIEDSGTANQTAPAIPARHKELLTESDFASIDYEEAADAERVSVTIASGWPLPSLIPTLLSQGVTGLQWYSRIPATLGGAIVNNIHGGTHFLSEVVESVRVISKEGTELQLSNEECAFEYDYSRFHHSGETIIDARLSLWKGDVARAQKTVAAWAVQKAAQPQQSLGCTFQNIAQTDEERLKLPTNSTGYIIDVLLGMKGKSIGGAQISPQHAAFIVNTGGASAADYLSLALEVHKRAREELGLSLKPEIFFKGFTAQELKELTLE